MSSSSSSFTLFRLPWIALREVLKNLNLVELLDLSTCSKIAANVIRSMSSSNLQYSQSPPIYRLQFTGFSGSNDFSVDYYERDEPRMPIDLLDGYDEMISRSKYQDIESLKKLLKTFGSGIIGLFYSKQKFSTLDAFNILKAKKSEIEIQWLELDHVFTEEAFKIVLDNLKPSNRLRIKSKNHFSSGFEYKLPYIPKNLQIHDSSFFKIDQLLEASDCEDIYLDKSKISNKDLELFLKTWANGGYPHLKEFSVKSEKFDRRTRVQGMKPTDSKRRNVYSKYSSPNEEVLEKGVYRTDSNGNQFWLSMSFDTFSTPSFLLMSDLMFFRLNP